MHTQQDRPFSILREVNEACEAEAQSRVHLQPHLPSLLALALALPQSISEAHGIPFLGGTYGTRSPELDVSAQWMLLDCHYQALHLDWVSAYVGSKAELPFVRLKPIP